MASGERGIFTPEDAQSEVDLQKRPPRTIEWRPNPTQCIELIIPPTVYPPREDTDLIANRLIQLGTWKRKEILGDWVWFRRPEYSRIITWMGCSCL